LKVVLIAGNSCVFHKQSDTQALSVTVSTIPGYAADSRRRPRIGIAAPVKEEAPYLLEWLAYHRALGVEKFMLGDNGGNDLTSELLQALAAIGVIERFDWLDAVAFQLMFYADAIPRMRNLVDICAVIDLDEFLRPLGECTDIPSAIGEIFFRPEVSAAGLSWVTYGSAGLIEAGEGLVIERFTKRACDEHLRHRVVKSVMRPDRFVEMINPHVAKITNGEYVNDRDEPARWAVNPATLEFASWNILRVDHFVVKSRREFEIKVRRGRATAPSGIQDRDETFFISRDLNDVYDPMPAEFVERTKIEMARLRDRLKAVVSSDSPLQALLGG
jgi:hypothetical protein